MASGTENNFCAIFLKFQKNSFDLAFRNLENSQTQLL